MNGCNRKRWISNPISAPNAVFKEVIPEAKRRGIDTTDAIGRVRSDVELQLELTDTPETRAIKRQLRTMNPQQRAQALRMLQAQADEAQRTGVAPPPVKAPRPQRPKRPKKNR